MVTFNNELEVARESILNWPDKHLLKCVTIVRDVFGRLSFLLLLWQVWHYSWQKRVRVL